jgi:hypothetical protein
MGKVPEDAEADQASVGIAHCFFSLGHCQAESRDQEEAKERLKLAESSLQQLRTVRARRHCDGLLDAPMLSDFQLTSHFGRNKDPNFRVPAARVASCNSVKFMAFQCRLMKNRTP